MDLSEFKTVELSLRGRLWTKIDAADAAMVLNFSRKWQPIRVKGGPYVRCVLWPRKGKHIFFLHRVITGAPDGKLVDHINHDTLDNRRSNLRIVTPQENMLNRRLQKNNTSGAAGVRWHPRAKRWIAILKRDRVAKYVGSFKTREEAVAARQAAVEAWTRARG